MEFQKSGNIEYVGQTKKEWPKEKTLAFTNEFREFISSEGHEGLMLEAKKAVDKFSGYHIAGEKTETERLDVEFLGVHQDRVRHDRKYFRIVLKDGTGDFFVKVNYDTKSRFEQGASEIIQMQSLEEGMKKFNNLGEFKVRVPEYCLGYKDAHSTYYVARYEECLRKTVGEFLENFVKNKEPVTQEEKDFAKEMLRKVKRLVSYAKENFLNYLDFNEQNMAYDKEKDEIVVFDVREL